MEIDRPPTLLPINYGLDPKQLAVLDLSCPDRFETEVFDNRINHGIRPFSVTLHLGMPVQQSILFNRSDDLNQGVPYAPVIDVEDVLIFTNSDSTLPTSYFNG